MKLRFISSLAVSLAILATTGTSFAAPMASKMLPNVTNAPSRFSGPGVYAGAPALPVTLSMVIAGGGPGKFDTVTLVKALAGSKAGAEVASLTKKFGGGKVGNFVKVFNYVVSDTLAIVTAKKIALPSTPSPDPKNGEALAGALWGAGNTGRTFSVEVMLDRAVSHPIHLQVMKDIDAKYGIASDADYHAVLNQAMHDLASVYHLDANGHMMGK
jgi:hypothetical protein